MKPDSVGFGAGKSDGDRLTELARLGLDIYERDLKAQLEPKYNRQFVVIHVDSGDYALGRSSATATREMLTRRSADGRLVVIRIGQEPECGLAARILASETAAGKLT